MVPRVGADTKLLKIDAQIAKLREALRKEGANTQEIQDQIDALKFARRLRIQEAAQTSFAE
jgi:hypothetical protein